MHIGKGKAEHAVIPNQIYLDLDLALHCIRGIADTDGSVFTSKKPGVESYPSIEITTCSPVLAGQIYQCLKQDGFRVAHVRSHQPKGDRLRVYRVGLYGFANLHRWMQRVGFSNPHKRRKAESILLTQSKSSSSIDISSLSSSSLPSFRKFSGSSVTP